MPSWVLNTLRVSHKSANSIARIERAFLRNRLFEEFIPSPSELDANLRLLLDPEHPAAMIAKFGARSLNEWCTANWGTKWDVGPYNENYLHVVSPTELHIMLQTAWGPPVRIFELWKKLGYRIDGHVDDENGNFAFVLVDGEPIGIPSAREFLDDAFARQSGSCRTSDQDPIAKASDEASKQLPLW